MDLMPRNFSFDDIFDNFLTDKSYSNMKCDIYEKGGDYHIEMDIPGFDKKDISIETKSLVLRSNLIHKMQNMDTLVNLEVLELYDNKIHEIKHFSHLVNLRLLFCLSLILSVLDLSFNKIKEIPDLSPLQRLEELFPLSFHLLTR